jgi:hypothetical protein
MLRKRNHLHKVNILNSLYEENTARMSVHLYSTATAISVGEFRIVLLK